MSVEESAIQLVPVPELWPPLGQEQPPLGREHLPAPAVETAGNVRSSAAEQGPALPRQFAILLTEVLAGVRPARQIAPWLSKRGTLHLHRLMPLCKSEQQPRVLRVLTTRPAPNVVEMTLIVVIGPRPRALAIRLEHSPQLQRWQCTDIESA